MKEIEELEKIRVALDTRNVNPDELSRAIVKLNSLLCYVGTRVAELRKAYELSYWERKRQYAYLKALAEGNLAQKEKEASEGIDDYRQDEIAKQYEYEYLKNIREDYKGYAMALQSRLNVLREERMASGKETT